MEVSVLLFAQARELVGETQTSVTLEEPNTVSALREALIAQHPALSPLIPHAMFAVNAQYAQDTQTIDEKCTIALIPPVSGG
ncbi:MAG: molybdopterin converting factor subunit 1 [Lacipirellulaceae bacterium]